MGRKGHALAPNPKLQNVKWRFLSEAALGPTNPDLPWTDGPKQRISHLEKALASTHDLEAQYQSFMHEVARSDPSGTVFDGVGPGWAGIRAMGSDVNTPLDADIIPSDPPPEAMAMHAADGEPALSAEDEEVARVQMQAASTEGSPDGDALSADRNSPSPVIIWRHAAPVKIASNVPSDLLGDGDSKAPSAPRRQSSLTKSSTSDSGADGHASAAPRPIAIDPRRAAASAALSRRQAYGVWYLPKEQWESRAQAAGSGGATQGKGKLNGTAGGGGGRHGASGGGPPSSPPAGGGAEGAEAEGASLAEQIPKLYSSRIYKDFLKAQRIHRMPHYLQRVESPKAQLSSRRGGIPMIDGVPADGADASS